MNTTAPYSPGENEPIDQVDDAILRDLARVFDMIDPPPPGLVDRVTFNLTLEGLNAEVAELQQGGLALARDDRPVESMTFSGSRTSLMVTVTPSADSLAPVRIDGWVTGGGTTVDLVTEDETLPQVADDRGRLVWTEVPRGAAHFVIRADDSAEPSTITPRVEL